MSKFNAPVAAALGLALALSGCTDPYDPGQRAVGGGLLGAGTGAAIGGIAGGGRGAGIGALVGGAVGAVGGAATTPTPPPPSYGYAPPPPPPGYYPQAGYSPAARLLSPTAWIQLLKRRYGEGRAPSRSSVWRRRCANEAHARITSTPVWIPAFRGNNKCAGNDDYRGMTNLAGMTNESPARAGGKDTEAVITPHRSR